MLYFSLASAIVCRADSVLRKGSPTLPSSFFALFPIKASLTNIIIITSISTPKLYPEHSPEAFANGVWTNRSSH
jgi:hypothetical protein